MRWRLLWCCIFSFGRLPRPFGRFALTFCRRRWGLWLRLWLWLTAELLTALLRLAFTATEHLHGAVLPDNHFGGVFVLTGLIGPFAGA